MHNPQPLAEQIEKLFNAQEEVDKLLLQIINKRHKRDAYSALAKKCQDINSMKTQIRIQIRMNR